jgi:hypothetical protein
VAETAVRDKEVLQEAKRQAVAEAEAAVAAAASAAGAVKQLSAERDRLQQQVGRNSLLCHFMVNCDLLLGFSQP